MPYGLSESCIQKAKQWLHDCTGAKGLEHTSCPPFVSSPLPTRTISIGKADQDLRLHISEPGEVAPYFSLSHCWGGKSCLTLSRDTLNDYVNDGIPFEKLPQTFRDAVSVTRALGVSYLWIDSLCIIQDSKEDWEAEAALMARVYENAQITIAAHAANDSTTGFLNAPARRPPRTTSLSSRGWVYQESLLAPRTLNFAATEMAWECHSITACECGAPQVELDHEKEVETGRRYPGTIKRNFAKLIWTDVVHEYTLRDLTVATDRLPALSGVVELFSRHRPEDQYLYGLWKTELPQHLCWLAAEPNQEARFPKSYAPTWSWASLQ
ncbi:HET-domain-containing protein, partial [Zopfia rhizophila CBS 207.26]